jgi:taurine dioxygenase
MAFTVHKLHPHTGAEIRDIDISQPLDQETIAGMRQAWLDHCVLVWRGQELDKDQQRRFVGYWGEIGGRARRLGAKAAREDEGPDYDADAMLISNIRKDGKPIGVLPDGELWFHHDMCYAPDPNRASFLYCIETPSTGGNTKFANMYQAYENLPQRLKDRIEGRTVLQVFDSVQDSRLDLEHCDLENLKHYRQPMVLRHPETGKRALYVNRLMSHLVEGLDQKQSNELLAELYDYTEDPALVYEHVWKPGDLLMWDNLCSIHARTDFPATERRLMRRMTIAGERVIPAWADTAAAQ